MTRHEPPGQLPRRYYGLAALAGAGLGLAAFAMARLTGPGRALLFAGGGLVGGLVLVALARLGIRLQRRDLPPPPPDSAPDDI